MARKKFTTFNLSFLDIMSCGFGAVILFYMIISAQVSVRADTENVALLGESNRLEDEVLAGRKDMVRLQTRVDESLQRMSSLEIDEQRLQAKIDDLKAKLSELDKTSLAANLSVEQLQSDIERLEEAKQRLLTETAAGDSQGGQVRSYTGEGNRQYLTGMKMGGKRILILVDASASMLGRTYVNAILYRNMPVSMKLRTPKWRGVIDAVDWLTARVPPDSDFQVLAFNTRAWSVVDGSGGKWVPAGDGVELTAAVKRLRTTVPESGTSFYNVFNAVAAMDPKPDNIYLLTDGLPTQGKSAPQEEKLVKPKDRLQYYAKSLGQLPPNIPVNVLLYPMDGDPDAAGYLWRLAIDTGGSFMTPSSDWP